MQMQARRRLASTELVPLAACAAGGLALGAAYALSAKARSPFTLPTWLVLAGAIVAAYRRPEIGLAAGLVLVPASTFGYKPDLLPLSSLLIVWSAYVALVAYRKRRSLQERLPASAIAVLLVLYICTAMLSVTQASSLHASAHVIARLLTAMLFFGATVLAVTDRRSLLWVLGGMTASAALVGAHATLDYLSGAHGAGFITTSGQLIGRATAGFGQPNQLGGFLVLLAPLAAAAAFMVRRGRTGFAVAALLAAFGVYASFSRGALIGLAIVPFVFLRGWRLWLAGPLLVLIVLLSAPTAVRDRFATLSSSGAEVGTRTDIWRAALTIWEQHPVLGVGVGGFPLAYAATPIPGKLFLPNTVFQPPPHAHNLFLNILAEQGIIGFVVFLLVILIALRACVRLRAGPERFERILGTGLLAALLAFMVHNLFDVTLFDSVTGPYVFVLLGLVAAAGLMTSPRMPAPAR
jgi:putative inorganic carbon (hco3(-)) transporter